MSKQITIVNLIGNKTCLNCGSNKTLLKAGKYERWYKYEAGFLCHYCYRLKNEDFKKYRKNDIYNKRRFLFRNRRIIFSYNLRKGFCTKCDNNIFVGSCNKTHMHHSLGYYIIFPWYGLVELCPKCHNEF